MRLDFLSSILDGPCGPHPTMNVDAPSLLYRFSKKIVYLWFRSGWRLTIRGHENIPEKGGVVVAANHRSYADPPLVGVSVRRPVHFVAKKELFSFRPFGRLIGALNAHPINRKSPAEALRKAEYLLSKGAVVVLFPEGGRSKTDAFRPAKGGAAMLALRANCPIVPAYIHNSAAMNRFRRVVVTFGAPIFPDRFTDQKELTTEIMKRIGELKDGFN